MKKLMENVGYVKKPGETVNIYILHTIHVNNLDSK